MPPPVTARLTPNTKRISNWYRFHNARTGHNRLLYLPDVRGTKEERYWDAWREELREQEAIQQAASTAPDPRPSYLAAEERRKLAADFAHHFESARLNRWREVAELLHPPMSQEERQLQMMANFLLSTGEPVAVEGGPNWQEATRKAYYAYCHQKLLEQLPAAYEEYLQRQSWGIAQPKRLDWDLSQYDMAQYFRGWLLVGRARLGEPEDFNF